MAPRKGVSERHATALNQLIDPGNEVKPNDVVEMGAILGLAAGDLGVDDFSSVFSQSTVHGESLDHV